MNRFIKCKHFSVIALLFVFLVSFVAGCGQQAPASNVPQQQTSQIQRSTVAANGVVASAHPLASQAGLDVLKKGGNAFDAAVATAFALGVVEPNASGIGGGGFAILYVAKENKSYVIDYDDVGPQKAKSNMYNRDENGKIIGDEKNTGYLSVCVPGEVRGMEMISKKFGSMKWADLINPAIQYAENGFKVSQTLNTILTDDFSRFDRIPSKAFYEKTYYSNGLPKQPGEIIKNPELAATLKKIAEKGADVFYTGEIADAIVKEFAKPGADGWITKEDLANYKPVLREPIQGTYRGYTVMTLPPPGCGTTVMDILNILEGYDVAKMGANSDQFYHVFAEAQKLAWADQDKYLGDPDFNKIPINGLTSKKYAEQQRALIDSQKASAKRKSEIDVTAYESPSTTSFTIVDKEGNMITVTQTLSHFMGSGVVAEGTGILFNDHMSSFSSNPKSKNAPEGGKRVLSSMSGTLVAKDGKPFLAVGTPGAARIISTVAQIIVNAVDFNMELQPAIVAPRVHCRNSDTISLEGRISAEVQKKLAERGHKVKTLKDMDLYFGGAQGAMYGKDGKIHGGADPRRDGVALGY